MEIKSRPGRPGNRCFGREKRNIVLQKKLLMSDLIVLCMRERDFAGFCILNIFFILKSKISIVYDF